MTPPPTDSVWTGRGSTEGRRGAGDCPQVEVTVVTGFVQSRSTSEVWLRALYATVAFHGVTR